MEINTPSITNSKIQIIVDYLDHPTSTDQSKYIKFAHTVTSYKKHRPAFQQKYPVNDLHSSIYYLYLPSITDHNNETTRKRN